MIGDGEGRRQIRRLDAGRENRSRCAVFVRFAAMDSCMVYTSESTLEPYHVVHSGAWMRGIPDLPTVRPCCRH